MERLHVYPKAGELYFLSRGSLWYTSNKPNSTAELVFKSPPKFDYITDFSIDYATDKLYYIEKFKGDFVLHCIDIETSSRLSKEGIVYRIKTLATEPSRAFNLAAFNNTFYWTTVESEMVTLHFKNGNKAVASLTGLSENSTLSFVSSKCPRMYIIN
ncbi:uncharacterized protein LOC122853508 [Aphidius gifuensis]|uniref:uncharacterized protein LOC122853508 n=1 Tax=Aphidius gifuensis TaxID=684658 RepID=UPI001CDC582C|nr:uncharacterized protein LOC122853508 [Aphidius gifuensis]